MSVDRRGQHRRHDDAILSAIAQRLSETKAASIKHAANTRQAYLQLKRARAHPTDVVRARVRYHAVLDLAAEVIGIEPEALEERLREACDG